MEDTLYIELNNYSCKLAVYESMNERFSLVDLSGGYGSVRIPYAMQISTWENKLDVLFGEDALLFDLQEDAKYIADIWGEDPHQEIMEARTLFFELVIAKVKALYKDCNFHRVFCYTQEDKDVKILEELFQMKVYPVYARDMARIFWELHPQVNRNCIGIHNGDELTIHSKNREGVGKLRLNIKQFDHYLRSILQEQNGIAQEDLSVWKLHQLNRLFLQNKTLLYRKLFSGKDVSLYSALVYPPMKITILAQDFLNYFYQETEHHDLKKWSEEIEIILGLDEGEDLIKNIGMGIQTDSNRILHLLYEYSRKQEALGIEPLTIHSRTEIGLLEKDKTITKVGIIEQMKVGSNRYSFLLHQCSEIKVIVSNDMRSEVFRIIDLPKGTWLMVLILIVTIGENHRINEVNYELRRV